MERRMSWTRWLRRPHLPVSSSLFQRGCQNTWEHTWGSHSVSLDSMALTQGGQASSAKAQTVKAFGLVGHQARLSAMTG